MNLAVGIEEVGVHLSFEHCKVCCGRFNVLQHTTDGFPVDAEVGAVDGVCTDIDRINVSYLGVDGCRDEEWTVSAETHLLVFGEYYLQRKLYF